MNNEISPDLQKSLNKLIKKYSKSFTDKVYGKENNDLDPIMELFNITPEIKRENRQYWGRELGMFWQLFVIEIFKNSVPNLYKPAKRYGADEPYDLIVGKYAIDTKYRVGSGDSGTLKKFKQYGKMLIDLGLEPVFLMVRDDNLPSAMTAIHSGGWKTYTSEETFKFIKEITGINVLELLKNYEDEFWIHR